jgi:hypothetical protein
MQPFFHRILQHSHSKKLRLIDLIGHRLSCPEIERSNVVRIDSDVHFVQHSPQKNCQSVKCRTLGESIRSYRTQPRCYKDARPHWFFILHGKYICTVETAGPIQSTAGIYTCLDQSRSRHIANPYDGGGHPGSLMSPSLQG